MFVKRTFSLCCFSNSKVSFNEKMREIRYKILLSGCEDIHDSALGEVNLVEMFILQDSYSELINTIYFFRNLCTYMISTFHQQHS